MIRILVLVIHSLLIIGKQIEIDLSAVATASIIADSGMVKQVR